MNSFFISKRAGHLYPLPALPSPSYILIARLWVWLNMHQYPWICLNILANAWINCSDYARALNIHDQWSSYRFDRLFKMPRALNKTGFCKWHNYLRVTQSSKYIWIFLIMAPYTLLMPKYASISLNIVYQ